MSRIQQAAIALHVVIFLLPFTYSAGADSPLWHHGVYMFFHANVFHLIANLWCARILNTHLFGRWTFPLLWVIAAGASFFEPRQVVGLSGVLFAMAGINWGVSPRLHWGLNFALIVGFIVPQFSGWVHLTSFLGGLLACRLYIMYNEYVECRRYIEGK